MSKEKLFKIFEKKAEQTDIDILFDYQFYKKMFQTLSFRELKLINKMEFPIGGNSDDLYICIIERLAREVKYAN